MTPNLPMIIDKKPSLNLISRYGSAEHVLKIQQTMLDFLLLGACVVPLEGPRSDVLFTMLTEKIKDVKTFKEQYENRSF